MPWKRVVGKGPRGNHVHNDHEATICRDDESVKRFKPGDIAWIQIRDSCWWPGQVVDEVTVDLRPKKRRNNGVLVRMYGCYEFLYVDPVKSINEFQNMLKQENLSIKEAFQKAMEEELSCVRSGGQSKEQLTESRDIATVDASKGKKQKQDVIERIDTDESPPNPAVSSSEADKASALEKKKYELKVKATTDKKWKQDGTTSLLVYIRTRCMASEDLCANEGIREPNIKEKSICKSEIEATGSKRLMQDKRTILQVYARTRTRASKGQITKQEAAREPNVKQKAGPGAAKVRETPKLASNITKRKDVEVKIAGKQKLEARTSKGDPKIKDMTKATSKQLKPKGGRECPIEKVGDDASRGKTNKQDAVGKANVTEKAKVSVPIGKNSKQEDVKEPTQTMSPGTIMIVEPEEPTPNLSERRMSVMQSLGLIAPLGSPYGR